MHGFRLEEKDEYSHVPTSEVNFNESVYVNAFDAQGRFGGWMRLGNRVNEGYAELSVVMYLPGGRVACQFGRPKIDTNERHAAGGIVYTVHEPFRHVAMRYTGETMQLAEPAAMRDPKAVFGAAQRLPTDILFDLQGVSPLHGGEPTSPDQPTMYGRDFSLGHFNQHLRASGHIQVGDERFDVSGFGWRDHSWGPRFWTNIYFYRLYIANFGPDRGFMLLKITDREGRARRVGVLMVDGRYEEILDMDIMTSWSPSKDPAAMQLGVRTAQRAVRIDGKVLTMLPLRNRRTQDGVELQSRIAEGFTEYTWDGRTGYGMVEYIEVLDGAGVPVGYPL